MERVLPPARQLPLFGVGATRRLERRMAGELAPHTLMRRAGEAVAHLALALAPHARTVWIAAGPGNNGGDGLEAAQHLHRRGKHVVVTLLADAQRLPADARDALARAQAAGVNLRQGEPPDLAPADIAVDALLGIGARDEPRGDVQALIRRLNALTCPVLAVDVPSGLNADTGQPLGDVDCVAASHTLSLLTLKPGLFTGRGRDLANEIWWHTLGATRGDDMPDAWLPGREDLGRWIPARRHGQHKGSFGDVAVVGGATGMTGAALLAGRAAHAAGAGRVLVNLLDGGSMSHDSVRPELMFRDRWLDNPPEVLASSTVVCGCGGGDAVRGALPRLLGRTARLVLDADALNAIAADSALQAMLTARAAAGRATVLTPHPLEATRLLGTNTSDLQADRLNAAMTLSRRFRCVVLLKGSGTVVAGPDEVPCINPTGNAALASAGTGDVLAGWLAGLWSQVPAQDLSVRDDVTRTAFRMAAAAAFMHGAAADGACQLPLRASELIEVMHRDRTRLAAV